MYLKKKGKGLYKQIQIEKVFFWLKIFSFSSKDLSWSKIFHVDFFETSKNLFSKAALIGLGKC